MSQAEEQDALGHFAKMETSYATILDSLNTETYQDACATLKNELSRIFYDGYLDLHPRRDLAIVDLVEFLGGFFLLDSQGSYDSEVASRVVGAIGTSVEACTLKELLTRLRAERRAEQLAVGSLASIRMVLWTAEDAFSLRKRQDLYQAIFLALGLHRIGLRQALEEIARGSNFYGPLTSGSARHLRDLLFLFRDSLGCEFKLDASVIPVAGRLLSKDYWDVLEELVCDAEGSLPESRKFSLAETLGRFYSTGPRDLMRNLGNASDHLLELVEQHVCPLIDARRGYPRNHQAQRRMRLKRGSRYQYDIGHFLPHSAGGPKDINLFVQERRLNRGWSDQGKRYRWFEKLVVSHPGILFFVTLVQDRMREKCFDRPLRRAQGILSPVCQDKNGGSVHGTSRQPVQSTPAKDPSRHVRRLGPEVGRRAVRQRLLLVDPPGGHALLSTGPR